VHDLFSGQQLVQEIFNIKKKQSNESKKHLLNVFFIPSVARFFLQFLLKK